MPGSSGKQRGGDFVAHERWSYLVEGRKIFREGKHISMCLDGVQLGEPLLNAVAWDDRAKVGCILPPQAGASGMASRVAGIENWLHSASEVEDIFGECNLL